VQLFDFSVIHETNHSTLKMEATFSFERTTIRSLKRSHV